MPSRSRRRSKSYIPAPDYLFVHEDASTVTRHPRDPAFHRQKQSHVQRRANQNRKGNEIKGEPPATIPYAAQAQVLDILTSSVRPGEELPNSVTFNSANYYNDESSGTTPTIGYNASSGTTTTITSSDSDLPQAWSGVQLVYRPGHFLEDTSKEPYDIGTVDAADQSITMTLQSPLRAATLQSMFTGPIHLTKWAPPLIAYFNQVLLPEKFWSDTLRVPLAQTRHADAIHADMRDIMSEPLHLYAFLAAASAQMIVREGSLRLPDLNISDQKISQLFKWKAIEDMRRSLSKNIITHRLVLDVHSLISNAYFSGAFDSAQPHVQAMTAMIEKLGGIETFDEYFIEARALLHWSAGLKQLSAPVIPLDFDPGYENTAITSILARLTIENMQAGRNLRNLSQKIPLDLARAARQHQELLRFQDWCRRSANYEPQSYRWLAFRRLATGYRLLSMPAASDKKAESFRLALIFWTGLTRCPTSGQRCASVRVHSLLETLLATDLESSWAEDATWLLWITVVGGMTSRKESDTFWFATIAKNAARQAGVKLEINDLEHALEGWLYEPIAQQGPLLRFLEVMQKV